MKTTGRLWAMNKKILFILILACALLGTVVVIQQYFKAPAQPYRTYFSYSDEELQSIRSLKSKYTTTSDDLISWQNLAFDLVSSNKSGSSQAAEFYAYLSAAQRDAAYLSYNHR